MVIGVAWISHVLLFQILVIACSGNTMLGLPLSNRKLGGNVLCKKELHLKS